MGFSWGLWVGAFNTGEGFNVREVCNNDEEIK
jgi:hypothetical protein